MHLKTGMPAVIGNNVLAALFGLGLILALMNKKIGLIIGMSAGAINVLVKVIIVFRGHEHFPYWSIVWISQSVIVIYFCYKALKTRMNNVVLSTREV